jgi:hypothetical protein
MQSKFLVFSFVAVVFIFGGLLYIYNPEPEEYTKNTDRLIICTADTMLCPDGTYVARSGSNCEFICPTATTTPENKKESLPLSQ